MKRALTICALVLSGCATWGDIDKGIAHFQGKSLDYAISRMGLPDAEQHIAGRKVYVWNSHAVGGGLVLPKTTTHTGTVGNTSYSGTSTSYETTPTYDLYCTVKLVVDDTNTVVDYHYDGQLGACERYARLAE